MTLEEYLGIWKLKTNGRSLPVGYGVLCREIEKLSPDEIGFQLVRRLEEEKFISVLPNGQRILTALGIKKRIALPVCPVVLSKSDEKHWMRFKRLCAYYADCVTQSEKTQEYLFANDLNTKYFLPSLPIDWLNSDAPINLTHSSVQRPAVNRIKSQLDDTEDAYIGYPLSAFRCSNGQMGYSPILLIPVDVSFDINKLTIIIRRDEIDINRSWLEFNVPRDDQKNVLSSLCFSAGEKTGLLDAGIAVQFIANRFKCELNPNYLEYNVSNNTKGVLNQAALFAGNPLKYSKTLKKELREIANQPAHVLDKTALAYVFRDPPLENRYEKEQALIPFDFLNVPSNSEQHNALKQALNFPVSKVTGPPGTGKSQVAVNLIANMAFNSQSTLFASKNHKAIHAIYERVSEVSSELSLVQFCSTPDGGTGATWMKQSIDDITAECDVIWHQNGFMEDPPFMRDFEDSLNNLRDVSSKIAVIDEARSLQQEIQAKYNAVVPRIPISPDLLTPIFRQKIESLAGKIGLSDDNRSLFQKLLDFLLMRKFIAGKAEKELRKLLPQLSGKTYSAETLRVRALRLCGDIADYLEVRSEELTLKEQDLELPSEQLKHLAHEMAFRKEHLSAAFLFKRTSEVQSVTEDVRQKLKNAASRISRQNNLPFLAQVMPESSTTNAQDAFVQFAKFFPAWATTLLSLSKASPCIAGLFDRVIIDEASQCEIPPVIPALYRAKGVTVIGDSAQFPPVITMRESRHEYIRSIKHKLIDLKDERFDFLSNSVYDLIIAGPLMLREHFRCHEDIASYFNEEYYSNKLKVRTDAHGLKFPRNMGFKRALVWRSVNDSLDGEVEEVKNLLLELKHNGYDGTIGMISPFRKVADRLKQELFEFQSLLDVEKDINTANGFQGGERDLIIFVLGITSNRSKGEDWYAVAPENRYIYNVAVSRARACLIVVGDREHARQSPSSALNNLAKDISQRPVQESSQSPGEEILYKALCNAGLKPVQQYPLAGRYLDMALVAEKIDIEVDGEAYHLNKYGERKQDDIYRDLQVQSNGWRVCRFWYREVCDNVDDCVAKVRQML